MLYILIGSFCCSVILSACCSLMEAALYSVPLAYVRHKAEEGSSAGKLLLRFKDNMGKPIASVLILNTIANTAGAAVCGWAAGELWGSRFLVIFSVCFTLIVLYCSEILPKLVGVVYCKPVSLMIARPLRILVALTRPLVWTTEMISRRVQGEGAPAVISLPEFLSMAELGQEEGALDHFEGSVISNVIGLDQLLVRDVLTPRVVVFRLEATLKIGDVASQIDEWTFSRIPLFEELSPDNLTAYVTQRDIHRELLKGNVEQSLSKISRPLKVVPELMRVDKLLLMMFEEREHICAVVDEHGGLAGIITMEDIIEEIVGQEIMDEYDTVSDLRKFANLLRITGARKRKRASTK